MQLCSTKQYLDVLCASFVVQSSYYWEVFCASFVAKVVLGSKVVLGRSLCMSHSTK